MEKIIVIIAIAFIFINSIILVTPLLFKRKSENYNQTATKQEHVQSNQINIDESNLDNFDSGPLINRHLSEIQQEKNDPVYIIKNDSEEQLGYNAISQLSPDIDPNKPFLIKPNIGGCIPVIRSWEDNGVINRITSPTFVKGIVKYLKEKRVKDIAIGEGWSTQMPQIMQDLFQISGYQKLAEEMGIKLIDLNYYNDGDKNNYPIKIKYPKAKLLKDDIYVPKIYLKYLAEGTIINVPKLKVHRYCITSLSLKNMMGVLMMKGDSPFFQANKNLMHEGILERGLGSTVKSEDEIKKYVSSFQLFSEKLSDLYVAVKPDFTIIEGYIGTEGDGFNKIKIREDHIAFASENQIYADYTASSYMGYINSLYLKTNFGFHSPLYLKEAFERFYQKTDLNKNIKVLNSENIEFNKKSFWHSSIFDI